MLKEPLSPAAQKALDQAKLHLLSADGDLASAFELGSSGRNRRPDMPGEARLLLAEVCLELQHALTELRRVASLRRWTRTSSQTWT